MSPYENILSAQCLLEQFRITYHRIDEFDTIVFGGVVACCNHDTDCSIALLGTETGDHSDGEHDMIEAVLTIV
jgi:hypothetical protein